MLEVCVSGGWLDILGPEGTRREALLEGLTRIGGPGSDIVLAGIDPSWGSAELRLWNRPPRVLFLGRGPQPVVAGRSFEEWALKPGDRVEWVGYTLTYGGEAASADIAKLEELSLAETGSADNRPALASGLAGRVRAGLACELGLADPQAMKRWRDAVLGQRFDPDVCARELLPRELGAEAEQRLLERSGTLLRDFLMAALLSGVAGARRKLREKSRGLIAFLVTQGLALIVFALLIAAALLVLRGKGTSIDALLDRFLPG